MNLFVGFIFKNCVYNVAVIAECTFNVCVFINFKN